MARNFAKLQRIDHNREITEKTDNAFLYGLQRALLLALREQGRLNARQYLHGEEALKRQCRERSGALQEEP